MVEVGPRPPPFSRHGSDVHSGTGCWGRRPTPQNSRAVPGTLVPIRCHDGRCNHGRHSKMATSGAVPRHMRRNHHRPTARIDCIGSHPCHCRHVRSNPDRPSDRVQRPEPLSPATWLNRRFSAPWLDQHLSPGPTAHLPATAAVVAVRPRSGLAPPRRDVTAPTVAPLAAAAQPTELAASQRPCPPLQRRSA